MCGDKVIFPIGYDSFWLPTENYAIKNNKSAHQATAENIKYYDEQLKAIDFAFDTDRKFATSDPEYYKWTQWIFTKLYQHNLVYRKDWLVNWCNGCQTVLANDQVVDGKCERCETEIIQKKHPQWYIKITDYADQLLDYSDCDRPEETKIHQTNWIGKSKGAEIDFTVQWAEQIITVFTTRPDTIYGVTAIVLAPENDIIDQYMTDENKLELANYRKTTALKTNIERQSTDKDKTWFDSGVQVIHPLTGELVPVRFADYVLPDYATGAVMFVPAHDERDWEFAQKYNMNIIKVIAKETGTKRENEQFADGWAWVVFDPVNQKYAMAEFADGRLLLFAGWVNEWETVYDAILREVREESGLFDFAYSEHIETSYAHYYNTAKQINRYARAECLLIILNSAQTHTTGLEEHEKFTLTWKSAQEVLSNWNERNTDGSLDHYIRFFTESVARAIKLWYDKTSDINLFRGEAYTGVGILENSQQFNGLDNITAKAEITKHLESIGKGKAKITYRLRDWSVSRQRYWGSPIPVYYTFEDNDDGRYTPDHPHPDKTKWIPHLIPESDLPVILPLDLPNYKPAGKSPLEDHPSFKYYHAPDGQTYLRECDTLDTFMCSSFYFLRFCDPHNTQELISSEAAKMMPVDLYVWGKEHTVWHLLYSRFIYKFLKDIGVVVCESKEPFRKLVHQGMVHASDGRKMSKRWGNVIDPMGIINEYGSDTLRTYTMFMWPVEASKNWNPDAVAWVYRFIGRVAKLKDKLATSDIIDAQILSTLHQTIKWVTEDIEALKFNTVVSKLMIMTNAFAEVNVINQPDYLIFLKLCAPFVTHMTQQMWSELGQEGSIHDSGWPVWDDALIATWSIDLPIQVNGKMRGTITVASWAAQDEVMTLARSHENIAKWLEWEIIKIIYVQDKICNVIIK